MTASFTSWGFWIFWGLAFLGFPLGGLAASLVVGPVIDPLLGLIAGAIAGVIIGLAEWLVLRGSLNLSVWWIAATGVGMALGLAIGIAMWGAETAGSPLLLRALVTGVCIGVAQWLVFRQAGVESLVWIAVVAIGWTLGWFMTRAIGVDLNQNWAVFGAAGALTFQVVTGLALYFLARPTVN